MRTLVAFLLASSATSFYTPHSAATLVKLNGRGGGLNDAFNNIAGNTPKKKKGKGVNKTPQWTVVSGVSIPKTGKLSGWELTIQGQAKKFTCVRPSEV